MSEVPPGLSSDDADHSPALQLVTSPGSVPTADVGPVQGPDEATLDAIAALARRVVPQRADDAEEFVRRYLRHVDPSDLAARRPEDLVGAALDHARIGARWNPGEHVVRVTHPTLSEHGWESDGTVVMVVTDDLPFLVDSVTMALTRCDVGIRLVVHPVLADRRGDAMVSFILVEIDRLAGAEQEEAVAAEVGRALDDVRIVVDDWAAMRTRALEAAGAIDQGDSGAAADPGARDEAVAFLRWLAADHFTFLGVRDYEIVDTDEGEVLRSVDGSGFGLLATAPPTTHRLDRLPERDRELIRRPRLLEITKADVRSTVHRRAFMDLISAKHIDGDGRVRGERRILGVFGSDVYRHGVERIPVLSRKVAEVIERSTYTPNGHDAKRLLAVLDAFPRDELFQMDTDEILTIAMGISQLQERRRVRVFVRCEPHGRRITVLVYLPRDQYTTTTRGAIGDILSEAFDADVVDWNTTVGESVLARLVFWLRPSGARGVDEVDIVHVESAVTGALRDWDDELTDLLGTTAAHPDAIAPAARYRGAFPAGYRAARSPEAALVDVAEIEALLDDGALRVRCRAHPPGPEMSVTLYRRGAGLSLTRVMPTLANLGLTVLEEHPHFVETTDGHAISVTEFAVRHDAPAATTDDVADLVGEALVGVIAGELVDDGFNRLVLGAGLRPSEVGVLRALARYLRQVSSQYSHDYMAQTLVHHPDVARSLFELFAARHDPGRDRSHDVPPLVMNVLASIDEISQLDEDRILRRFLGLVMAVVRTNFHQRDASGNPPAVLALKIEPRELDEVPEPRPAFEIFVHGRRVEGVHLRSGPVARGGLRWSDRIEDYRTEILGLVKAQIVKNSVIVPAGAKGGFIVIDAASIDDPDRRRREVRECYALFVEALLSITDNLVDGSPVRPASTRCLDGPDPYLVVAADKGTASFSDTANEIALARGFWLGDAFASGGSHGYDHKAMGITARGAWESVRRHFREMGIDADTAPLSVAGIGDMSGDVFGNGMLLSDRIRLVAAFDHRHIFIDPDPDPSVAHAERRRLFELPGSSWGHYDRSLISFGGGVFARSTKSITLSDPAREALGTDAEKVTPEELITIILQAPVDLLWNGGIGTWVKASTESHLTVGDKVNDSVRADASDLRCRVIGEGGNLGITQRARIEFALAGGRVFTDAIDNSAGVDCSDHEVNVKVLLGAPCRRGELDDDARNELLESMTDDIAAHVLADNVGQTIALGLGAAQSVSMTGVHAHLLTTLENHGAVNRQLDALPTGEELAARRGAGLGLTPPELAVVLAVTKNRLSEDLLASTVPDVASLRGLLRTYFPGPLRRRFAADIDAHPLRREIIANRLANRVIDRAGTTMVHRLSDDAGAAPSSVALAHLCAWEVLGLERLWTEAAGLDLSVDGETQVAALLAVRRLGERATRWVLARHPGEFDPTTVVDEFGADARALLGRLPDLLLGDARRSFLAEVQRGVDRAMPPELSWEIAGLQAGAAVLDIVEIAHTTNVELDQAAGIHLALAARLELDWVRRLIDALPRGQRVEASARLELRRALERTHRDLTAAALDERGFVELDCPPLDEEGVDMADIVDVWLASRPEALRQWQSSVGEVRMAARSDLPALIVLQRELARLRDAFA